MVDWDEFGLGSRALDLMALALDCARAGDHAASGRLLARAVSATGRDGLRSLVSYRALALLAYHSRAGGPDAVATWVGVISETLGRLSQDQG